MVGGADVVVTSTRTVVVVDGTTGATGAAALDGGGTEVAPSAVGGIGADEGRAGASNRVVVVVATWRAFAATVVFGCAMVEVARVATVAGERRSCDDTAFPDAAPVAGVTGPTVVIVAGACFTDSVANSGGTAVVVA